MVSSENIIAISIGEVSGIGVELILKVFSNKQMFELCTPVVYGSTRVLSYFKKNYQIQVPVYGVPDASKAQKGKINVVNIIREEIKITPGTPSEASGRLAALSLQAAVEDLKKGYTDKLVTCPIDKNNIQSEIFDFPGHTEFLARTFDAESSMILTSDSLKVALLTGHVPLHKVSSSISKKRIIKNVKLLSESLQKDFGISKPRIALLGLNPHAGDRGLLGNEETEKYIPTVEELQKQGVLCYGPYPSDGFFGNMLYQSFDAVMASYHDQGLAPFKALSFGSGVNFTAGLPIIRTSPDHGTAYDIAGQNKADVSSFRQAIFTALEISKTRSEFIEYSKNSI